MANELKNHPQEEQLLAFGLGKLDPDESSRIAAHLDVCHDCSETIVSLQDDTFVGLVRNSPAPPIVPRGETGSDDLTAHHEHASPQLLEGALPRELATHPRYEILGLIGKGGMGDVYEARHRMMDRRVAIKIINRDLTQNIEVVDRFRREVKAAAQLSHPHIVTAHDAEQAGQVHFMVMEYVDGIELSELVKSCGPLPISDACEYVCQVATGLQHAFEQGMVHRDIKPHNLMVTSDGTVKILDFGLASLAPSPSTGADEALPAHGDLTSAGAIMGTPDFISPEQADDARRADIRSDIYSLGATLYFLLSGKAPFADLSLLDKLKHHAQSTPRPLNEFIPGLPVQLDETIQLMMAKKPEARIQSPAEVALALAPFIQKDSEGQGKHSPTDQPQPKKPQPTTSPRQHRIPRPLKVAMALFGLATVMAALATLIPQDDGPYMVGGGNVVTSDNWQFLSGSLYLKQDEPGVLMGLTQRPTGERELSYVVLFRHEVNNRSAVSRPLKSSLNFDGHLARMNSGIEIDGKGIRLQLDLQLDKQQRAIVSRSMTIAGKPVDDADGRLFLVDLTTEKVTWTQVKAKLPQDLPALRGLTNNTEAVAKLAKRLAEYDEVRKFLAMGESNQVEEQLAILDKTLEIYRLNMGRYPTTKQGLNILVQRPASADEAASWRGPYLAELPLDAWGRPLKYAYPGKRDKDASRPEVWSVGADGKDGTPDDVGNWSRQQRPESQPDP